MASDSIADHNAPEKLQAYLSEIERKNSEIEQFVYTVSHDLKTPLVTIQSFLGFLEEDLNNQDLDGARDALARIQGASRRMRELIDDILTISRLGRQRLNCQLVDVQDLVTLLLEELAVEYHEGDRLVFDTPLPTIVADPVHLQQIFNNLLKNTLRHGRRAGQALEASIGYCRHGDEHWFYVRDKGPGVAPENQRRIFHLFQKFGSPASTGTGAGLTVVEKLLALHQGRIWLDTASQEGATFWFTIPTTLDLPQEASVQVKEDSPSKESPAKTT